MSDPSQSASGDNPYAPGDAAVDMQEPSLKQKQEEDGSEFRIAHSAPPREPTIGRAFDNYQALLRRGMGTVGLSWGLLFVAVFVITFVGLLGAMLFGEVLGGPETMMLLMIPGGLIGLLLGGLYMVLYIGLTGALRQVGFFGEYAIPTVTDAYKVGLNRAGPILGAVFGWMLCLVVPMAMMVGAAAIEPMAMVVAAFFAVPLSFALGFVAAPLFYIIPATTLGLGDALKEAFRVAKTHALYLALAFLIFIVAYFAVACVVGVVGLIPILGQIFSLFANLFIQYAVWIGFVAVIGTIEEAEGGFRGGLTNSDQAAGDDEMGGPDFSPDGGPSLYGGDNQVAGGGDSGNEKAGPYDENW